MLQHKVKPRSLKNFCSHKNKIIKIISTVSHFLLPEDGVIFVNKVNKISSGRTSRENVSILYRKYTNRRPKLRCQRKDNLIREK